MFVSFFRRARKLRYLLGSSGYRRGLRHGIAAAIEHAGAMRTLEIGTLIDVGANIGQFSLLVRTLHPGACIHAFEPLPTMSAKFESLFKGDRNAHLYRLAAGDTPGTAEIHVSARPDSSSLLRITELQDKTFPGTAEVSVLAIKVARIDDVLGGASLPEPILIKLDVQGFELSALKGMPKLLHRARHVYAEISFKELYERQPLAHDIVAWLTANGFRLDGIYNPTEAADGSSVQADALFTKADFWGPQKP